MPGRYFDDCAAADGQYYNFRNLFPRQKQLCEKFATLQLGGINNLTLRLCLTQHAFRELFTIVLEVRQKTRVHDYQFIAHELSDTSTSGIATVLAVPSGDALGEIVNIRLHDIHQYFYSYCTFAVGVLDRLAVEIRECYNLNQIKIEKIDWKYLLENKKQLQQYSLYKLLDDPINSFGELRDKRNKLVHRTFYEIHPGQGGNNFDYFIEGEIPLIAFTNEQMVAILRLCNDVYGIIHDDIKAKQLF